MKEIHFRDNLHKKKFVNQRNIIRVDDVNVFFWREIMEYH